MIETIRHAIATADIISILRGLAPLWEEVRDGDPEAPPELWVALDYLQRHRPEWAMVQAIAQKLDEEGVEALDAVAVESPYSPVYLWDGDRGRVRLGEIYSSPAGGEEEEQLGLILDHDLEGLLVLISGLGPIHMSPHAHTIQNAALRAIQRAWTEGMGQWGNWCVWGDWPEHWRQALPTPPEEYELGEGDSLYLHPEEARVFLSDETGDYHLAHDPTQPHVPESTLVPVRVEYFKVLGQLVSGGAPAQAIEQMRLVTSVTWGQEALVAWDETANNPRLDFGQAMEYIAMISALAAGEDLFDDHADWQAEMERLGLQGWPKP